MAITTELRMKPLLERVLAKREIPKALGGARWLSRDDTTVRKHCYPTHSPRRLLAASRSPPSPQTDPLLIIVSFED